MDTHALSEPALASAVEVFAANQITITLQERLRYTPTSVISHAILTFNHAHPGMKADGIVITPSHNPPEDGGFKYNPPEGGPAPPETTQAIQDRANQILASALKEVKRMPFERALRLETTREYEYVTPYVEDLRNVIEMGPVAASAIKIGVDPLGGAAIDFRDPIAERYELPRKSGTHTFRTTRSVE